MKATTAFKFLDHLGTIALYLIFVTFLVGFLVGLWVFWGYVFSGAWI